MKDSRYLITSEKYENHIGTFVYSYIDKEDNETYSFSIDKDYNFYFNKDVVERDLYLAYIEYVNKTCVDYFFKKLKLEKVPKGYVAMYEKLTADYSAQISKYIELALENIEKASNLIDQSSEENVNDYYNKVSCLNQAQRELSKAKSLTRKR